MSVFEQAFARIIGNEGGFTNNQADPGNWTGGKPGEGECKGTKFGVSAKAYPDLDIANLTLEDARAIFKRDYWDKISGDRLPPPLALLTADAAYNNGPGRARQWLQMAAGTKPDGVIGPVTLAALAAGNGVDLCVEFMAQRTAFMASLPTWKTFGLGWSRRLARLPFQAVVMTGEG
jgi:lysozyme family protein